MMFSLTFIVPILGIIITNIISVADADDSFCHVANATCYLQEQCRVRMELLQSTCGPYGEYCTLPQPRPGRKKESFVDYCQSALRSVVVRERSLRCYCPFAMAAEDYRRCIKVWRFLNQHPCSDKPKWKPRDTPPPPTTQSRFIPNPPPPDPRPEDKFDKENPTQLPVHEQLKELEKELGIVVPDDPADNPSSSKSCAKAHSVCSRNAECKPARSTFLQYCAGDVKVDSCNSRRSTCLGAYEKSRHSGIFACSCENDPKRKSCRRRQRKLTNSRCLELYNTQSIYGIDLKQPKEEPKSVIKTKKPYIEPFKPPNCYALYTQCARNSHCLERMVQLTESCRWNTVTGRCGNYRMCLSALRTFYGATVGGISAQAVHCQCPPGDSGCERQKEVFRPPCAYRSDRPDIPSCIQVYEACHQQENRETCVPPLNFYRRNCDVDPDAKRCVRSADTCRKFQRVIWGTVLTQNCTCDPAINNHPKLYNKSYQQLCQKMKKLFTDPPCIALERQRTKPVQPVEPPTKAQLDSKMCSLIRQRYLGSEVRLYQNTTCSQLCDCEYGGETSKCRLLMCKKQESRCHWGQIDTKNCKCEYGDTVCLAKLKPGYIKPGLYLNIGYSQSEERAVNQQSGKPIDFRLMTQLLNGLMATVANAGNCQLSLVPEFDQGSAVFKASLSRTRQRRHRRQLMRDGTVIGRGSAQLPTLEQRVFASCGNPVKLLSLLIEQRYPEIAHHPHLSVMKTARVEPVAERLINAGSEGVLVKDSTSPKQSAPQSADKNTATVSANFSVSMVIMSVLTNLLLSWWSGCCSDDHRR